MEFGYRMGGGVTEDQLGEEPSFQAEAELEKKTEDRMGVASGHS